MPAASIKCGVVRASGNRAVAISKQCEAPLPTGSVLAWVSLQSGFLVIVLGQLH